MQYLLLLTIFLASCSDKSNVLSGPFLIKDEITYHQTTTKPITGELHSFYANGQLKDRTSYIKGLRDGLFEAFYDNGQLRERVTYLSGIKNGLQETFSADGKLTQSLPLVDGIAHGVRTQYFRVDNKDIRYHVGFVNGLVDGVYEYYMDDVLVEQGMNSNGRRDGVFTTFHSNSRVKETLRYADGKKNGSIEGYWSTGEKALLGRYNDGNADGDFRVFDLKGDLYASWRCNAGVYLVDSMFFSIPDMTKSRLALLIKEDSYQNDPCGNLLDEYWQ